MERPAETQPLVDGFAKRFVRQSVFRLHWMTVGAALSIIVRRLSLPHVESWPEHYLPEQRNGLDHLRATFLATVSHELRTPITAARAGLGLLEASLNESFALFQGFPMPCNRIDNRLI